MKKYEMTLNYGRITRIRHKDVEIYIDQVTPVIIDEDDYKEFSKEVVQSSIRMNNENIPCKIPRFNFKEINVPESGTEQDNDSNQSQDSTIKTEPKKTSTKAKKATKNSKKAKSKKKKENKTNDIESTEQGSGEADTSGQL